MRHKKHDKIVNDYQKIKSKHLDKLADKFGLDLWSWEDMFAKSLEGLINYSFTPELVEVILWYVYEHSLAEDEEDKIVNFGDEAFVIETAEDLYKLICLVEE